ncbi:MAG: AmmeMemoRadiSam system radical SAM enzyme [Anaerolineae bacterium]|nr:AmmeMemoRadiSam system radical SAM enzyme [Anaerolineae bacterium]
MEKRDRSGQESPFIREALLQEPADGKVRCLTCERRCLLAEGQAGWCRTRRNIGGRLHTLIYGAVSSLSANPIEKKPLYHFHPGTVALTAGSWGCNFDCPWCQNWDISKSPPAGGRFMTPAQFVAETVRRGCQGTSISFNEPTLSLEWSLEIFRLARARGLYNTYVSNGYMTARALELLVEAGLEAMNVDVKGDAQTVRRYCGTEVEVVWRNCRLAKAAGVWLEVTTLVIPGVNDDADTLRGIAGRIAGELGPETPWHVSGYYPAYRFTAPPTPVGTLEQAQAIGKEAGLDYVYVGNVVGHPGENTTCPQCGRRLVERFGLRVRRCDVVAGCCPHCGRRIAGVGWPGPGQTTPQIFNESFS